MHFLEFWERNRCYDHFCKWSFHGKIPDLSNNTFSFQFITFQDRQRDFTLKLLIDPTSRVMFSFYKILFLFSFLFFFLNKIVYTIKSSWSSFTSSMYNKLFFPFPRRNIVLLAFNKNELLLFFMLSLTWYGARRSKRYKQD